MPATQSKEVNLTKRIQTSKGMRYCPVVLSANGRVKLDLVLVSGKPERHPEGAYCLEWCENGRRIYLSAKTHRMPLHAASAKKPNSMR